MKRLWPLMVLPLAYLVAGCNPAASEAEDKPVTRKVVAFQGKVDLKFVGVWKTANGTSTLDIRKDGSLGIASSSPSPRGIVKTNLEGKWLVSGEDLIMRYKPANQPETTIHYPALLEGDKLTLGSTNSVEMVYDRQKKAEKKK